MRYDELPEVLKSHTAKRDAWVRTRSRRFATAALCAVGCLLAAQGPVPAREGLDALCPFLLHERQVELDDLELAIQLARPRLEVAEEIFVLLDRLWHDDAVERLIYLQGKHHRDRAKVDLERARWRVERQEAVIEQYSLVCSASFEQELVSEKRRILERAYRRYREADCKVRALDISSAEVELEHLRENLVSVRALREDAVASRQQVILTEHEVELMLKQLEQARQREARCTQEVAELWGESPK